MSIYKKLLEVQRLWLVVAKDSINPQFKNKYASLDSIIVAYSAPLSENWLVITHASLVDKNLLVTTITDTESGDIIATDFPVNFATTPQAIGSQLTYAKRYNLWALLNIATDEDDDGNTASKDTNKPKVEVPTKLKELQNKWIAKMWQDKFQLLTRWYQVKYEHPTADLLTDDEILEMAFTIQDYTPQHLEEFINNLINKNEIPSEQQWS